MKDSLPIISQEISECTKCELHEKRTNVVPGEGNEKAQVMFIGEGPGAEEDKQGRPFVGRSGKFLREMINLVGFTEDEVFIANVVKCRPPGNRDPKTEEITVCRPYLDRQIRVIKPKVIVTLGRHAMERELPGMKISQVHGKVYRRKNGKFYVPLYHPAVALYSSSQKDTLIKDMRKLARLVKQING